MVAHNRHYKYNISDWVPDLEKPPELISEDMTFNVGRGTFQIDGDLSDWACYDFKAQVPFTSYGQGVAKHSGVLTDDYDPTKFMFAEAYMYNGGIWTGAYDTSMAVSFAWNPNNFYTAVKVFDDEHQLQGRTGWNGEKQSAAAV